MNLFAPVDVNIVIVNPATDELNGCRSTGRLSEGSKDCVDCTYIKREFCSILLSASDLIGQRMHTYTSLLFFFPLSKRQRIFIFKLESLCPHFETCSLLSSHFFHFSSTHHPQAQVNANKPSKKLQTR